MQQPSKQEQPVIATMAKPEVDPAKRRELAERLAAFLKQQANKAGVLAPEKAGDHVQANSDQD